MDTSHFTHPQEEPKELPQTEPNASALSDAIGRLLQNPELIATVASSIGIKPSAVNASLSPETPPKDPSPAPAPADGNDLHESVAALAPLLSGILRTDVSSSPREEQRACLLQALKPYVSRNRADAIDTILQLSKISGLFRHMT